MTVEQQREQFIRGLNPMNQYNLRMMAKFNETQDNITEALSEAERWMHRDQRGIRTNVPPSPAFHPASSFVPQQQRLYSDADIEKLVNERIASRGLQPHIAQAQPTQTDFQAQPTRTDLQAQPTQTDFQDAIKMLVDAMKSSQRTLAKKPSPARKKADDIRVDRFLRDQLKDMIPDDIDNNYGYDYDPVEEMRRQLEEFHINTVKKLAKAQYRCSNCDKSGHNSRNCPKKKKKRRRASKRGKVNLVVDDSDTNSDGETETESSSASEGEISVNIAKVKKK
jgi:hypothetical protein